MDANRFDNPFLAPLAFLAVESLTGETLAGKKALALAALMHEDVGAERFVGEYVSTVARQTRGRNEKSLEAYLNSVRTYFQTI